MQRMICIPSSQYSQMLESYDNAMRELQELKEQLQGAQCDADEVAPVQQADIYRDAIMALVSSNNDPEYLQAVYSFADAYPHSRVAEAGGQVSDSKKQCLNRIVDILAATDEKTLKELYYLVQGYAGRVF